MKGKESENFVNKRKGDKKGGLSISSIDFVGLGFADKKKTRGLPAGLVPMADPFSGEDLPEVEIIVGDTSKFDAATASESKPTQEDDSDIYKPKVSTWGVFPRPGNISKTVNSCFYSAFGKKNSMSRLLCWKRLCAFYLQCMCLS